MKLIHLVNEIQRGEFNEVTYTDGEDEVMVHVDQNDDPIRAYVYNDSPLINFDYDAYDLPKKAKGYRWQFIQSKNNPLFYHLDLPEDRMKDFVGWIKQMGYIKS
jgi:hypothetical protein